MSAGRTLTARRSERAGARAFAVSVLLHAGAIAWSAGQLASGGPEAEWTSASAPSAPACSLALRAPEAARATVAPTAQDREAMPDPPPLPLFELAAAPSPDPAGHAAVAATGLGLPRDAAFAPDRPQRRDWLRRVAKVEQAAPVLANAGTAPPAAASAGGAFVDASPCAGQNAPPAYPFVAWRRGIAGTVVVLLEIDAQGRVTAAHVERSSGSGMLDDAALEKLATWHFQPARRSGLPVASTFLQPVVFRLVDGRPVADT